MPQKRKTTGSVAQTKSSSAREGERLQKVLAAAGVASRRRCEEYIVAGRVVVDGKTVTKLGTRVDPLEQEICVDGVRLRRPRHLYYIVNKPVGIVSTNSDPSGRPRVIDLIPSHGQRLFTVGRLDKSSEGLILVTNDGELAQRLTHPQYEVEKTYDVVVAGNLSPSKARELERGVRLADGLAQVAGLKIKNRSPKSTRVQMVLREGRNREIRRVLASVGHKVLQLRRVRIASLSLGELQPGEFRQLNSAEVSMLRRAVNRSASNGKADETRRKTSTLTGYRSSARRGTTTGGPRKGTTTSGTRKGTTTSGAKRKTATAGDSHKSTATTGGRKNTSSSDSGRKTTKATAGRKGTGAGGGRKSMAAGGGRKTTKAAGGRKTSTVAGGRKSTSSRPTKGRGKSKVNRR